MCKMSAKRLQIYAFDPSLWQKNIFFILHFFLYMLSIKKVYTRDVKNVNFIKQYSYVTLLQILFDSTVYILYSISILDILYIL